jgi:hypothetical protein
MHLLNDYSPLTLVLLALCLVGFIAVMASFYLGWRARRLAAHQRRTGSYDHEVSSPLRRGK